MGEEVAVPIDRTRQWPDAHDVAFDLDHLGDGPDRVLTDDQPRPLDDELGIRRLVGERPRQAGVVLAAEVDRQLVGLSRGCAPRRGARSGSPHGRTIEAR